MHADLKIISKKTWFVNKKTTSQIWGPNVHWNWTIGSKIDKNCFQDMIAFCTTIKKHFENVLVLVLKCEIKDFIFIGK